MEKGPAGNTSLTAAFSLAQEMDEDEIIVAQETEYTGAGKGINPQLSFARRNGIELLFGDPASEVPGKNIIFPAHPSLLKARDLDLSDLKRRFIRRAVKNLTRPLLPEEISFLAEETRSDGAFVLDAVKAL